MMGNEVWKVIHGLINLDKNSMHLYAKVPFERSRRVQHDGTLASACLAKEACKIGTFDPRAQCLSSHLRSLALALAPRCAPRFASSLSSATAHARVVHPRSDNRPAGTGLAIPIPSLANPLSSHQVMPHAGATSHIYSVASTACAA